MRSVPLGRWACAFNQVFKITFAAVVSRNACEFNTVEAVCGISNEARTTVILTV